MNDRNAYGACETYEVDIAELVDGTLAPSHATVVRQHLLDCRLCSAWHDELVAMNASLEAVLPRPALSAGFAADLQAHIDELTTARRRAYETARSAAQSEYERMCVTLRGWGWRAVLNGVAAASVMGGTLLSVRSLSPALAQALEVRDPVLLLQMFSVTVGVTLGVFVSAWARGYAAGQPSARVI